MCVTAASGEVARFTREVTFGAGDAVHGQIDRPNGQGPFPLVFLLPAGGAVDRHGTSPSLKALVDIYEPIARDAVEAGWAIFRYDRFAPGRSEISAALFLDDALAGLRRALDMPTVDRTRVVIIANGYGTVQLRDSMERFLEVIGHAELKGTILLASELPPSAAAEIPGDLLVINGEADGDTDSPTMGGVLAAHRRAFPRATTEGIVLPGCGHALCDTTLVAWTGLQGTGGSCAIPDEAYAAIRRFIRRIHSAR